MKKPIKEILFIAMLALLIVLCSYKDGEKVNSRHPQNSYKIPHLEKQGTATQLIVENKPFLILGGELGNSTFTSIEYMKPIWPKLKTMNLNTVLAPVYWELIEPVEGKFDFTLYDQLIQEARKNNLKIVILWFGSWKNSMSSHAPSWVKKNQERFPRIKDDKGMSHEILTPLSEENLMADLKAYQALMQHIKEFDGENHTIIMIQTENEIGMLPTARDYSSLANKKFQEAVPEEFIEYLKKNKDNLVPEFKEKWAVNGYKDSGSWEEIFGKGVSTDEIFMAWYYAKYTNQIIKAGKETYPLPMYVNAALNRPGRLPGEGYPSAGPLPHIMDVWKAGGPSIDFLAPDIYFPNIEYWCDLYTRQQNPLFIPEAGADPSAAPKALFTIGHYQSLGYSPFSIESNQNPEGDDLGKVYNLIAQLSPLLSAHRGKKEIDGVLLDDQKQETKITFGNYEFTVRHSYTLGYEAEAKEKFWVPGGAIIIQTGENEFYVAGSGVVITFKNFNNPELTVGILKTEEGRFDNDQWTVIRHLNGDQIHQGRHVRIFKRDFSILRFELYNYN
jgi:beta-galactosidase GanA